MMPLRTIISTFAFLALASPIFGQQPAFVVGERIAGSVGFYDAQFKRLGGVKVGVHPHEVSLAADKRTLLAADNGVVWMTETGPAACGSIHHGRTGAGTRRGRTLRWCE